MYEAENSDDPDYVDSYETEETETETKHKSTKKNSCGRKRNKKGQKTSNTEQVRKDIKRKRLYALAIFDVFRAHQNEDFLSYLHKNRIRTIFVSVSPTEELQPCDRSVNGKFKSKLKQKFVEWHAEQLSDELKRGVRIENVTVDLKTSNVKPIHANWLLSVFDEISKDKHCVIEGFKLVIGQTSRWMSTINSELQIRNIELRVQDSGLYNEILVDIKDEIEYKHQSIQ
ncbi:hypothetical protein KUTeg_009053 [Tegillarca granosa]|uniref:DDE-1 domain-containing protein n=1 Tax=Tegillarca granosa TaxID=220873 RepID=A0ABQ9FCP4_TEGGR|nr:hypothetical protein KUTeg_009053 [Tegillarca granosa]